MTGDLVVIVLILAVAGFIRGAFGFGDGLFAMPLLAILLPIEAAAPLMAFVALLMAIVILFQEWRAIEFRPAAILIVAGIAGIPFGVLALRYVDERIVKSGLGIFVILFAVWSWARPDKFSLKSDRTAPLFGFCAGLLGGAYNTSGPPLVIYAALRRWPVEQFRAMIQAYCIVSSIMIIAMHSIVGHVSGQTFEAFAISLLPIIAATALGQRLTRRLAMERFIRLVYALLILVGLGLLWSSLASAPETPEIPPPSLVLTDR